MVARLDLIRQGKLFLQLTSRHLTLFLFMRRKLGSSSQAGRETERKRKSVPTPTPWESITQPCLRFPNAFWFSRKLWAKQQPSFFASPQGLSQICTPCIVCVCARLWQKPKQKYKCLYKELSFHSSFGINTRVVFSSFWWNSSLRQLELILIVSIPTEIFLICLLIC